MEKENIYNSICRICLCYGNSKKMIPLFDKNSQDCLTAYAKAVLTFAQISFTKGDSFPSYMCIKCLFLLKQAIRFKLLTESSDNCLQNLKNSVGSDTENLKEKIIEYAMFKFYFPTDYFGTTSECVEGKNELNHTGTRLILKKDMNVMKSQSHSSSNSVDDAFFGNGPESDTEQNSEQNGEKILDKIGSLIDPISLNAQPPLRRFKRKTIGSKIVYLKHKYKQNIKQDSTQKKDFVCNVCKRVLANQYTYEHHMQRHMGCRFVCEHCGKGFPVLNELQIHQVTKHGTGPYLQCSHCPYKAPRKFDLVEHERIHTGERPYTCDKCGLTFRRREIWRKHLLHHSEKKVQCPHCPRKFYLRCEMLAHANNIHERLYVYSCSQCDATYTKTATVRRHLTERHGIPREMQGKIIRINKRAGY